MLSLRLAPVALVFLLALGTVACGSSDAAPAPTGPTPTPNPALFDASHALAVSAKSLARDTLPADAEFNWDITRDGFSINGHGTLLLQATGDMFLSAHYEGKGDLPQKFNEANDSELLIVGQSIYFNTPVLANEWYVYTPQQFGTDLDVAQRLISARSPLDLAAVATGLTGATRIGSETIDGKSYAHFNASVDAGALMDALADAYGSQGQVMIANHFDGPIQTEFWIDPVTLLPRRLRANGQFTYLSGATNLSLTLDFVDSKDGADFPETPTDAIPVQ
jgi:hypothetical protein